MNGAVSGAFGGRARIEARFAKLREEGRAALVTYVMSGDPDLETSARILAGLPAAGADIIELGLAFTDPMADGPSIQAAGLRALKAGVTLRKTLAMAAAFRVRDTATPIILMGYYNPIYIYGAERFAEQAADAGVDGLIVVDLPPEEADEVAPLFTARNLDAIFLLAPTTTDDRIRAISEHSSGYVYYVSVKGVTGSAAIDVEEVGRKVAKVHRITAWRVGVGFGTRYADTAAAVGKVSDGVIVGSVLVDTIAHHQTDPAALRQALTDLLHPMREALDALA